MARRRPPILHGVAIVDKPAGMTSHDVVGVARRQLGERRIGHSGTLDPDATGVLLLGIGHVTRLLRFLTGLGKTYTAEIVLGVATSTLDSSGEVTGRFDMSAITLADVRRAAVALTGEIDQVPPMVSALQVDGVRLHVLARQGIEIEREPRRVTVQRFDIDATDAANVYRCEVRCSSGTYVRSLADDLGHRLGGGAHLRALRRTAIGSFGENEASALEAIVVQPPLVALRDYSSVEVDAATAAFVRNGRVLSRDAFAGDGPWSVVCGDELLAMYESHGALVKPAVVISASTAS